MTTLPKTTYNISHLTRAKHGQITRKNSRFLHINRGMETFLTQDLFKILDVNERFWTEVTELPAIQTIFN